MTDLCVKIRLKVSIVGIVETERRQRVRFAHLDRPKRESCSFSRFRKRGELYALCATRTVVPILPRIASLKEVRRPNGVPGYWSKAAYDGSPLVMRDVGTQ